MLGLSVVQWVLIASVIAIFAAVKLWPSIKARLPSWPSATTPVATIDDDADLAAFKRLRVRLAKCPEAVKALDGVWSHFWHVEGDK